MNSSIRASVLPYENVEADAEGGAAAIVDLTLIHVSTHEPIATVTWEMNRQELDDWPIDRLVG